MRNVTAKFSSPEDKRSIQKRAAPIAAASSVIGLVFLDPSESQWPVLKEAEYLDYSVNVRITDAKMQRILT